MASALFKKLLERVPKETKDEVHRSVAYALRIHKLMRKQGISQIEFAQMMNESEDTISSWLSGMYSFTIEDLARVQTFFDRYATPVSKKNNIPKMTHKSKLLHKHSISTQKLYNNNSDDTELIRIGEKKQAKVENIAVDTFSVRAKTSITKKIYEKL